MSFQRRSEEVLHGHPHVLHFNSRRFWILYIKDLQKVKLMHIKSLLCTLHIFYTSGDDSIND